MDRFQKSISYETKEISHIIYVNKELVRGQYFTVLLNNVQRRIATFHTMNLKPTLNSGSDIAMEAGDIVILGGNLTRIYEAIRISSLSLRKIKQNLFWAFFYNSIGIGLASGLLYPLTGIHLNPLIAGIAMILSDLVVVPNPLLLSKLYRTVNGVASATHFPRRELGI